MPRWVKTALTAFVFDSSLRGNAWPGCRGFDCCLLKGCEQRFHPANRAGGIAARAAGRRLGSGPSGRRSNDSGKPRWAGRSARAKAGATGATETVLLRPTDIPKRLGPMDTHGRNLEAPHRARSDPWPLRYSSALVRFLPQRAAAIFFPSARRSSTDSRCHRISAIFLRA